MLITLKTYSTVHEAAADKSYLEANGIKCHLEDENTVAADPLSWIAIGGVKLQVYKKHFQKAEKLLE